MVLTLQRDWEIRVMLADYEARGWLVLSKPCLRVEGDQMSFLSSYLPENWYRTDRPVVPWLITLLRRVVGTINCGHVQMGHVLLTALQSS